ncbi:MAG: hypothetical protein ABSD11_15695 [Methylocella sp.]|jgi:Skp family chaperone for outer membrane proteins
MLKTGMLLCAMSLASAGALHAGEAIVVEKLTKPQLQEALKTASDDTVIQYQGQIKTKAQWRSEFQAKYKPLDAAKLQELADARKAKFEAAKKALQDEQDRNIQAQNAQTRAEFDKLRPH